jgi:hypothetical protein
MWVLHFDPRLLRLRGLHKQVKGGKLFSLFLFKALQFFSVSVIGTFVPLFNFLAFELELRPNSGGASDISISVIVV